MRESGFQAGLLRARMEQRGKRRSHVDEDRRPTVQPAKSDRPEARSGAIKGVESKRMLTITGAKHGHRLSARNGWDRAEVPLR
jgi:hypothetical protein